MKGILIRLLAVVLATLAVHADDQQAEDEAAESKPPCAFGFCMGQTIEGRPDDEMQGVSYKHYDHRAFREGVAVYWTEATGVCMVRGFDVVVDPDDAGNAHKLAFNRYVELVTRKHGEPYKTVDAVNQEHTWPQFWLMELQRGTRDLASLWIERLPEGIDAIAVQAKPTFIEVRYEFSNYGECMESIGDDF